MKLWILAAAALALAACTKEKAADAADGSTAATERAPEAGAESAPDAGGAPVNDPAIPTGETGGMCGGIAALPCLNAGDYCMMAEGNCVDIADASGTCTKKPEACTMQYDPVCGCDGKTYGNSCAAAAEGVSVASKGECPKAE